MPRESPKSTRAIYQLKITLRHSIPPIWRRVLVPGSFSLFKLHRVIQVTMGWTDDHLHQFIVAGEHFSIPSPEDWMPVIDERLFTLEGISPCVKSKFEYEYDFGDSWLHQIAVEKIVPLEPGAEYPQCIKGNRGCPPEVLEAFGGDEGFLEAVQDPDHEERDSYLEWIAEDDFNPQLLDLATINQALPRVKQ